MAQTQQKTECSFIPIVINKYTDRVYTWRNRVPRGALERLELLDAKVSRAVLRGRDGDNTVLLLDTLATCSDGTTFENPRALKHALKKLKRLERTKSRRKKGSQNRVKTRFQIAKTHARIAHIRKDATHKLTSHLAKNSALIAIEDLHVNGMLKNHKLAQAVSDSNFGEIRRQLEYKAEWHGTHLVTIDRFYPSSKTCSGCGYVKPLLSLSERVFVCEGCGMVLDRDLNAAINLRTVAVGFTDTRNAYGQFGSGFLNGGSETELDEVGTKQANVA